MWIVYVTPPAMVRDPLVEMLDRRPWDFRAGFFPRKVWYLSMAKELAVDARRRGGTDIRIERVK